MSEKLGLRTFQAGLKKVATSSTWLHKDEGIWNYSDNISISLSFDQFACASRDRQRTPDFPSTSKSAASPPWMLLTLIAMHQPSVILLDLFLYLTVMVSVFLSLASAAQLNAYSQFKTWDPVTWFCGGRSPASLQRVPYINFISWWLYLHLYEPVVDTCSRTSLNSLNTAGWSLQLFCSPSVTSAYVKIWNYCVMRSQRGNINK